VVGSLQRRERAWLHAIFCAAAPVHWIWRDKIVFRKLNLANPGQVPIGPNTVIEDDLGFTRAA